MAPSFTPGPWKLDGWMVCATDAEQSYICEVYSWAANPRDEAIARRNASLIVAAPDLLDACRKALYALKGREHDGFLRDAIAKAEGSAS